jgi:Photoprotection regulator fluorescence recovery protein
MVALDPRTPDSRLGGKSMSFVQRFIEHIPWTQSEKKVARKAFDHAFEMHCASIKAETEKMIANSAASSDIWRVHDYLSERRRTVNALYDYRYSVLLDVFAKLLCDGWIVEADLAGLAEDKIDRIKRGASCWSR